MAKKVSNNGVDITTARQGDRWFFLRGQVNEALEYSPKFVYNGVEPLEIGSQQYVPFEVLQDALQTATGPRKEKALGLLQRISEQLGIALALNKPGTMIADLDDTSAKWAKARIELKAARQLLNECEAKERELWAAMEKERKDG